MITERILQLLENKRITKYKFCKDLGLSNGFLDKPREISTDRYANILVYFSDVNPEWLLTGNGEMLKNTRPVKVYDPENAPRNKKLIPIYAGVSTIGGNNELVAMGQSQEGIEEWIDAGDWFKDATAGIHHYGDSMLEYPSGCILPLKQVQDMQLLVWGKNYVIETSEFRITKQLQHDKKGNFIAYSTNEATYSDGRLIHAPVVIPRSAVGRLFLVLGCVTKEFSNGAVAMRH